MLRRLAAVGLLGLVASGLQCVIAGPSQADSTGEGGVYTSLPYVRIVDTVTGTGGSATPFSAGQVRTYNVLGTGGIPVSGVGAVLIDVAVPSTTSTAGTNITVWKSGDIKPSTANLRVTTDTVPRSNTVAVAVGADGAIAVASSAGTTDLNIDVQGYFSSVGSDSQAQAGGFVPVSPTRVLDTGTGQGVGGVVGQLAGGSSLTVDVATSASGIPDGASAAFANIAVRDISSDGNLKVAVGGTSPSGLRPWLNYAQGAPNDQGSALPLSAAGTVTILNAGTDPVTLRLDVQGYFAATSDLGGGFRAEPGISVFNGTLAAKESRDVTVGGLADLPQYGVAAALIGVTESVASGSGAVGISLYRAGFGDPGLANLRASDNTTVSTTLAVRPGNLGRVTISNNGDQAVSVKVLLQGWFTAQRAVSTSDETAFRTGASAAGYADDWVSQAIFDRDMRDVTAVTLTEQDVDDALAYRDIDTTTTPSEKLDVEPIAPEKTASTCRKLTATLKGQNVAGATLWTFKQTSQWCYANDKFTYKYSQLTVSSPFLGWDYYGLTDDQSSSGNPWIRYRQGHFKQCLSMPWGDVCAHNTYPWIKHTMYADGTYQTAHGIK